MKLLPVVTGTLFLVLAACRRHPRMDDRFPEITLNDAQKAQTLTAMGRLRDQFNRGACRSIYDDGSAGFRSQPVDHWLHECATLQNELGSWTGFQGKDIEGFGKGPVVVFIYGQAEFQKENPQFEFNWVLSEKGACLHSIRLRKNESEDWVEFPEFRPARRWQDPPVKVPRDAFAS